MKISVKVKPNAKAERVEKENDNQFILWVKAPGREGKANAEAVELLGKYFHLPKSRIAIIKGNKSRNKIISIEE